MLCATVVLSANYLSGQAWLPVGNLAMVIGVLHCAGGTVGGALDFGLVEGLTVCALLVVPVAYALTAIEGEDTFRVAFPLVAGKVASTQVGDT